MATLEELVVKLSADTAELRAELKNAAGVVQKSTKDMQSSIDELSKGSKNNTEGMSKGWETFVGFLGSQVVIGAFNAVKDVASQLFDVLVVDGVKSAIASEESLNKLANALGRTSSQTNGTIQEWDAWANALESTTRFQDDAIISSAGLIANITKLGGQDLKNATEAATNLSAALGIDLEQAATMVAKSIEGNSGALGKYGVHVEETSSRSKNLAATLDTLNSKFGGAAAAQTKTFGGVIDQVGKSFEDFTKSVGKTIIQNKSVIDAIKPISALFQTLQNSVDNNADTIRVRIGEAIQKMVEFGKSVLTIVNFIYPLLATLGTAFVELGKTIGNVAGAIAVALGGDFKGAWNALKATSTDSMKAITESMHAQLPLYDTLTNTLNQVGAAAKSGLGQLAPEAAKAQEPIRGTAAAVDQIKGKFTEAQQAAIDFADAVLKSSMSAQDTYKLEVEALQTSFDAKLITEEEFMARRMELLIESQAAEQALLDEGLALKGASEQQYLDAQLALMAKQDVAKNAQAQKDKQRTAQMNEERLNQTSQMFGNLATLTRTGSKELGAIGKAAAIAQASIDTYVAANKALAQGGPFLGPALAASIVIAGLVNVAKIASTPLAGGIDSVPGIGGSDNFPAVLAPGERVVPSNTNQDLTAFLANQSSQPKTQISVAVTMNDVFTSDPREMGVKIINVINEVATANGVKILGSSVA